MASSRLLSLWLRSRIRQPLLAQRRPISCTPPRWERPILTRIRGSKMYRKITKYPDAVAAVERFAIMLEDQGIDLAKGHDISTLDLFRLAANAEFRKAQKDMYDELEKAGFDAKKLYEEWVKNSGKSE
ncbi:hypothetical protein K443DRAFT_86675 [Laccaria amethystina LaAM-08-1]|uniref:Uncharacterized protein n=1 Tax=Laccaria amethystina LaAM-08-1 TaxID=1095629 RepID=A0A0C9YHW0_9AGAR|nr:hypothetical protein K443DRAFT_86675 [Laccaria amethystina LaAM-08-1]